jgi:hexosaminidase
MEAVKLNVFHWHLTDDQGFRIESRVFPKLHELGSDGNYYTREDIREVVEYARDRGIRIVPEIDMPGHSGTWMIGYPELGSAPGPYAIIPTFGIYDPTLDPTQDRVYTFIDKLLGDIATLFPDEYLHIGGDEVNGKHWKANAGIQNFIRQRGLKDEAGLQAWFNRRVEPIVRKHGKKMMGWDEVLHPDLPREVLVQSWRDHESLAKAVKQGHRTLLSFGYYLDHLDTSKVYYMVDPLGGPARGLSDAEAANVLGGEACMWTEFVSPETVDSRIWPMTAAIAERLWSPRSVTDLASMFERLDIVSRQLDWRGVRHNTNYESMLRRLSETAPMEDLRVLADAVEPLGIDGREITRTYTQSTPLNRFVDAARGESAVVRRMEAEAARVISGASDAEIERTFRAWRDNAARLGLHFAGNALLNEAAGVSRDLSRTGEIGLEALVRLRSRQAAPEWVAATLVELDRLSKPQVEVVLAAVRPVRQLVLALQRR